MRVSRVLIFPFASANAEGGSMQPAICRGLAAFLDEKVGAIEGIETVQQHLIITPDNDESRYGWLVLGQKWTLEQVLELPIPDSLGATHILHGEVHWTDSNWSVELHLVDIELRETVLERYVSAPPEDFLPALLSSLAGMCTDTLHAPPLSVSAALNLPTDSGEAFESYLMGVAYTAARRLNMPGVSASSCLTSFLAAIDADPEYVDACQRLNSVAMVALFEEKSEAAECVDALKRAIELAPTFHGFGATLGMWHALNGDDDTGQVLLEAFVAAESAPRPLSHGLAILGTIYRRQGRGHDARTTLERAVENDGENLTAWEELAACHAEAGHADKAEVCLRRALDIDPERALSLLNLGSIYWGRGDFERAVVLFERGVAAPGAPPDARSRLALASLRTGNHARADEVATEWAESEPEEAEPWLLLARIRREIGDLDGMRFCLAKVREMATSDSIQAALQLEELGAVSPQDHALFISLVRPGAETSDAPHDEHVPPVALRIEVLRSLAARHVESLPIWMALVEQIIATENWEEAASVQGRVVSLLIKSHAQWNILGVLRARAGLTKEAILAFESATRLSPKTPSYHTNLGLCHAELGDPERARLEFKAAIALGEESPVAALELLKLSGGKLDTNIDPDAPGGGAFQKLMARLDDIRRKIASEEDGGTPS